MHTPFPAVPDKDLVPSCHGTRNSRHAKISSHIAAPTRSETKPLLFASLRDQMPFDWSQMAGRGRRGPPQRSPWRRVARPRAASAPDGQESMAHGGGLDGTCQDRFAMLFATVDGGDGGPRSIGSVTWGRAGGVTCFGDESAFRGDASAPLERRSDIARLDRQN